MPEVIGMKQEELNHLAKIIDSSIPRPAAPRWSVRARNRVGQARARARRDLAVEALTKMYASDGLRCLCGRGESCPICDGRRRAAMVISFLHEVARGRPTSSEDWGVSLEIKL